MSNVVNFGCVLPLLIMHSLCHGKITSVASKYKNKDNTSAEIGVVWREEAVTWLILKLKGERAIQGEMHWAAHRMGKMNCCFLTVAPNIVQVENVKSEDNGLTTGSKDDVKLYEGKWQNWLNVGKLKSILCKICSRLCQKHVQYNQFLTFDVCYRCIFKAINFYHFPP